MKPSGNKRELRAGLLWLLPAAFLLIFFYQPLLAILRLAFSPAFCWADPPVTLKKTTGNISPKVANWVLLPAAGLKARHQDESDAMAIQTIYDYSVILSDFTINLTSGPN